MDNRIEKARSILRRKVQQKQAHIKAVAENITEATEEMNKKLQEGNLLSGIGYAESINRYSNEITSLYKEIRQYVEQLNLLEYLEEEE